MSVKGRVFEDFTLHDNAVAVGNGAAVEVAKRAPGAMEEMLVQITGITTATITFEGTLDGTNWVAIQFTSLATGTAATTATADGLYKANIQGLDQVRARISAWTAGTIDVTARVTA